MPEEMNGECDICGKYFVYLSQHRRNVHKVYLTDTKRRVKRRKPSKALVKVEPEVVVEENHNTIRRMPNLEVVTDGKKIGIVEWIR